MGEAWIVFAAYFLSIIIRADISYHTQASIAQNYDAPKQSGNIPVEPIKINYYQSEWAFNFSGELC